MRIQVNYPRTKDSWACHEQSSSWRWGCWQSLANQGLHLAINRQNGRGRVVCTLCNIDRCVPICVKHNTIIAVISATMTLTVTLTSSAIHLTCPCWGNWYHLLSNKCCLMGQHLPKPCKGYLRQGIVMPCTFEPFLGTGGLILNLLQILKDINACVASQQSVCCSVKHVLGHIPFLSLHLRKVLLCWTCALAPQTAFEVT